MDNHLNGDKIAYLFDFVRSKYVRYLDVQHELVDHLATGIEAEMQADATLDFEKALDIVYSRFPITGFSTFVSAKYKSIWWFWIRQIHSQLSKYYYIPLLLSFSSVLSIIYSAVLYYGRSGLIAMYVGTLIGSLMALYKLKSVVEGKKGSLFNKPDNLGKYLFLDVFYGISTCFLLAPLYSINILFSNTHTWNYTFSGLQWPILVVSILFTIETLWVILAITIYPKMLRSVVGSKYKYLHIALG